MEIQEFHALLYTDDGLRAAYRSVAAALHAARILVRSPGVNGFPHAAPGCAMDVGMCNRYGHELGGPTVVRAQRMLQLVRPGQILVSQAVASHLDHHPETQASLRAVDGAGVDRVYEVSA